MKSYLMDRMKLLSLALLFVSIMVLDSVYLHNYIKIALACAYGLYLILSIYYKIKNRNQNPPT
ncbi:hypothetical protein VR7878_01738 [Vibrio ruber DSM 16370]|uniref:Uncharacterized protein n=1 Tax=Vibrio ruber (strain DSM 16370 / JCM 11486 / BCRC 17186 / CECT 7878 / LMG 23124 / VR1) TaxID=1123498 RepID=A0A1R4LIJ7_VIBR1|nr:hypothetical protein VR7878_01738 [Vibrio ruber DSM 16370]